MKIIHRVFAVIFGVGSVCMWVAYFYLTNNIKYGLLSIWLTIFFTLSVILAEIEELKHKKVGCGR